ncbi:MAG: hypothetical protein IT232_08675 [Flavobacteriales bacterium]|nr:hypothetical protein [Flavobacteriales bacterium]
MKKFILNTLLITSVLISCKNEDENTERINEKIKEEISLREIKSKEYFIEIIKKDSIWMESINQKAKERNISVDEMLTIDAEYMVARDAEIVKIENDIIRDTVWLDLVKKKAEKQGLKLDEMLTNDATFMYEEKLKNEQ